MRRSVSQYSNLDALRGEAKRWLKAISARDLEALGRFRNVFPDHTGVPRLRQVQHALAREHGLPSWAALKQEVEDRARTSAERVRLFLEKSVNRYGTNPSTQKWGDYERDGPARGALAARLLARHPKIARDSIHTAVAAHDLDAVRTLLRKNPALARDRHVFDGWTPLLRLAYARLPIEAASANAVAVASLLLDAGADPNAGWSDNAPEFTALVGVIGGGEAGQAAHPMAEAFARLLIARGAEIDPFELRYGGTPLTHAIYHERADMMELLVPYSRNFRGLCFAGAIDRLHELLAEELNRANREDHPGEPALFCLPNDEEKAVEVAELLLSSGADPTFRNPLGQTPAQVARRRGLDDAAALLEDAAKNPE
jgi:ankyrin repeat protein